jgi:hypothetical protein
VSVPLAVCGVAAAHALANAVFGSPDGAGELFESGRSGRGLVPLLVGICVGLVVVGLVGRLVGGKGQRPGVGAPLFGSLPPVLFVGLELTEALLHPGGLEWAHLVGVTFWAGLLLQLPFAVAVYVVVRLLLRASDAVRQLFGRTLSPVSAGAVFVPGWSPSIAWAPFEHGQSAFSERAPPAGGTAPA